MAYYNLKKSNYTFKFGAGAGFHLFKLDNEINPTSTLSYTASGFSFRGEVIFAPKLSKNLYTYLSGFVFVSSASSLKDSNGNFLKGSSTGKEVNLCMELGYGLVYLLFLDGRNFESYYLELFRFDGISSCKQLAPCVLFSFWVERYRSPHTLSFRLVL
jgi:hypothetical protein